MSAATDAVEQLPPPTDSGEAVTPVLAAWLSEHAPPELRDALLAGLWARHEFGVKKYGQGLMTNDGRKTAVEVWQEILDALQYAQKAEMCGEAIDTPLLAATLLLLCRKVLRSDEAGDLDAAARRAYAAYNETGPMDRHWKTFDGRPVPAWDELPVVIQEKWRAAVFAGAGGRR